MKSADYKAIIASIVRNSLKRAYPGLKLVKLKSVSEQIARSVHARMYGANVDGVDSPIWRDCGANQYAEGKNQPTIEAKELLNE